MSGYDFYRDRTELCFELIADTPIHIGSGFDTPSAVANEGAIAEISLGLDGRPAIPPTTLKGVLLALARAAELDHESLFGIPRDRFKRGETVRPGICIPIVALATENSTLDIVRHVAIDGASGTAAGGKLYASRVVSRGTRFTSGMTLYAAPDDPRVEAVRRLLSHWQEHGIRVGRSTRDGDGLLRLDTITSAKRVHVDAGKVVIDEAPALLAAWRASLGSAKELTLPYRRFRLVLTGTEPFIVKSDAPLKPNEPKNLIKPRQIGDGPELPGSSLSGVLRGRALWWARREFMRGRKIDAVALVNRWFGQTDTVVRSLRAKGDTRANGSAGLVAIESITASSGQSDTYESVKIDRFSGAPFEGGLFTVKAFPNVRFDAALSFDPRRAEDGDGDLFEDFLSWLAAPGPSSGLTLGLGGNRGFGWFDVAFERIP